MGDFFNRCKCGFNRALDRIILGGSVANFMLVIVAALLLISLMLHPGLLVALALLGLIIWLAL